MREFRRPIAGKDKYHIWRVEVLDDTMVVEHSPAPYLRGENLGLKKIVKQFPPSRTTTGAAFAQTKAMALIAEKLKQGFVEVNQETGELMGTFDEDPLGDFLAFPASFRTVLPKSWTGGEFGNSRKMGTEKIFRLLRQGKILLYPSHQGTRVHLMVNREEKIIISTNSGRDITERLPRIVAALERARLPRRTILTGILTGRNKWGRNDGRIAKSITAGTPKNAQSALFLLSHMPEIYLLDILFWDGIDTMTGITFRQSRQLHRTLLPTPPPFFHLEEEVRLPWEEAVSLAQERRHGLLIYQADHRPKQTECFTLHARNNVNTHVREFFPLQVEEFIAYFNPALAYGGGKVSFHQGEKLVGSFSLYGLKVNEIFYFGPCRLGLTEQSKKEFFLLAQKTGGVIGKIKCSFTDFSGAVSQEFIDEGVKPTQKEVRAQNPCLLELLETESDELTKARALLPKWDGETQTKWGLNQPEPEVDDHPPAE